MATPYYTRTETDILNKKLYDVVQETTTGFLGVIDLSSPMPEMTVVGFWIPTESGTYIKYGNINVDLTKGLVLITYNGYFFKKVEIPIEWSGDNLPEDLKIALKEMTDFVPSDYSVIFETHSNL